MSPQSPVLVVEHRTGSPAVDSLVAAELAAAWERTAGGELSVRFVRLRGPGTEKGLAGGTAHATAHGTLVANGLLWPERALGRPVISAVDEIVGTGQPACEPEVIALNPALFPDTSREDLMAAVTARAPNAIWVEVEDRGSSFQAFAIDKDGGRRQVGAWVRDRYGRPAIANPFLAAELLPSLSGSRLSSGAAAAAPIPIVPAETAGAGAEPKLVLIAEPDYHRHVYPAVLAAIGDASDTLGLRPAVDIVSPRDLATDDMDAVVVAADGVLLPGGCDIGQVSGQIMAAAAALKRQVPTLGICLGMQTMAVAVARTRAHMAQADLEEVNPAARPRVFTRLRSAAGVPEHRLGAKTIHIQSTTRLAALYGRERVIERLNHCYALNRMVLPSLEQAGLSVGAVSDNGAIVDAVEYPAHPFFAGLQGHPELSSRAPCPHPLFLGFLREVTARQRRASETGRRP